jgi:hypothetical protein
VDGAHELVVAARGFENHGTTIVLEPGESRRLPPIRLDEALQLYGLVTDYERGTPVAGATIVSLVPPGVIQASADHEGRFVVAVGPDTEMEVSGNGYVAIRIAGEIPMGSSEDVPTQIRLSRGGRIRVLAWDDSTGSQCVGCSVAVVGITPLASEGDSLITSSTGEAVSKALAPGRYGVGLERVRGLGSIVTVSGGGDLKSAAVAPGETVFVELGLARRAVRIPPVPTLNHSWRLRLSNGRRAKCWPRMKRESLRSCATGASNISSRSWTSIPKPKLRLEPYPRTMRKRRLPYQSLRLLCRERLRERHACTKSTSGPFLDLARP